MEFIKNITFRLQSGQLVELAMTKEFMDQVRSALSLPVSAEVSEQQVKTFLVGSMKNALEKSGE